MLATSSLILYTFRKKNLGPQTKYPVHLRITFQRYPKTYSLRISMNEKEFGKLLKGGQVKEEHQHIMHFLNKARNIIQDLKEDFTWEEFESKFFSKKVQTKAVDLLESLREYGEQMKNQGRIKTFQSYHSTIGRIKLYRKNKVLPTRLINPEWLFGFAEHLKNNGLNPSSISTYTRNIRTVFNWEISRGRLKQDAYPFGRNKFTPPSSTRVKKALTYEDVIKIFEYEPETTSEEWCRDMWLFTYLGNGMNVKDLALLKYKDIAGKELHFVRAKTQRKTIDNQKVVHVFLHPQMEQIIEKWGNPDKLPNNYIFKIMEYGVPSPMQETRNVNQAVKNINKYMKRIGHKLELSKIPTCNFARHTYSTILKRANVPIEVISEALGHFSVRTTEIYLDSFESDKREEISKFLLPDAGAKI